MKDPPGMDLGVLKLRKGVPGYNGSMGMGRCGFKTGKEISNPDKVEG